MRHLLSRLPFTHYLEQQSPIEIKNALLRWCQLKTALYPQINIANFTSSWRDGLAMCALLHHHRPYLIDFAALASATTSPISRLSEAFALAKKAFQIPIIVNPADFIAWSNNERCVVAVVATWYYQLNKDHEFKKSASRLAVVLDRVVTSERRMLMYVKEVYILRKWMKTSMRYLEELSKFSDAKLISSKLAHWQEIEKKRKVEELGQIEAAWLQLKMQNLAWGYVSPSPPAGFDYPTIYRTWEQFGEVEAACMKQIWQGQKIQSLKKQELDKFCKKAEVHKLWLLECDRLFNLTIQTDFQGVHTSLQKWYSKSQISTDLLKHQRALVQRGLQKNTALVADAEAHHNQKMKILFNSRPYDGIFYQIRRYWKVLTDKFHRRDEFLRKRLACLDKLLKIVGLTEELEIIRSQVLNQNPTEDDLNIWESKYNAAAEKVSSMTFDWNFIAQIKWERIVGCCYAQFWGVNWAIGCILLCYKNFYLETAKCAELYCNICKSLTTTEDRIEHTRVLFELIGQTPISVFSIRSIDPFAPILSKARLLIHEADEESVGYSVLTDDTTDMKSRKFCAKTKSSQSATNLSNSMLLRRSRSLEIIPEGQIGYESSRKQRNAVAVRIHKEFKPWHLTGLDAIRRLKASFQQKLVLKRKETEEKRAMLYAKTERLHGELSTLQIVVDLLTSIPEIQTETNEIREWIRHEIAYFMESPIPDILAELLNYLDVSAECWWEGLPGLGAVFLRNMHIQSRIRQKCMILEKIIDLRKVLNRIEYRFLQNNGVNPEDQPQNDDSSSFRRIAVQTQAAILSELTKMHQSLNEVNQEATKRHEQLLVEQAKMHAIQRCCELLQWIRQSQKCLSKIEFPFLHISTKDFTEFSTLMMNEPFLVALEREITFHTKASLPVLHEFQDRIPSDSLWSYFLEHIYDAWNDLIHFARMNRLSVDTAKRLQHLNGQLLSTICWIKHKKELLITTGETKNTMREMIRMECRMAGWETDLNALKEQVRQVFGEVDALNVALEELQSPLSGESENRVAIRAAKLTLKELNSKLYRDWEEFKSLLDEYQKRLEASLAFQNMLQELEAMNTALMNKHNAINSLELPSSISEINEQMEVFHTINTELEGLGEKMDALAAHGEYLATGQEEVVAVTVKERLDALKTEWSDLIILCNHQLGRLAHQHDIKVRVQNHMLTSGVKTIFISTAVA
ncbi:unnamed protein product [Hydatigera taeniaeformis]|uniref:Calponin-homology (CH) domain-containing protein n=1 Tax=Hydatigena taeniaeformis TaxID=6205 RepID=A0A0R3WMV0_HYDTA|nr:unnamed protein product [Hydatigera taeniaeformis]